jgi:putative acetyltransferase
MIRPEHPHDGDAVRSVHRTAFPTDDEARLVDCLRAAGRASVSLVAEIDGRVVGHVLFSPVTVTSAGGEWHGLGLAPMAVLPDQQCRGIGSALVRDGLAACAAAGCAFVIVLGHADYYPRFGFRRGSDFGITSEFGGGDSFMIVELLPGTLPADGGLARYGPEFDEWRKG